MNEWADGRINRTIRVLLAVFGLLSWAAGAVVAFRVDNGAGSAALIVAGSVTAVLGLMGRWPARIALSGNEVSWEHVNATVKSQIEVAAESDDSDTVLAQLTDLRERLAVLQRTGVVPEHPAQVYDRAVIAAIGRLLPSAEVIELGLHSRTVPDYLVRYEGQDLLVETKWRADPWQPFRGSTLPQLIEILPPAAGLAVIVNSIMPPLPSACQMLRDSLGERGRIVAWMGVTDDAQLGAALADLLATAPAALPPRGGPAST